MKRNILELFVSPYTDYDVIIKQLNYMQNIYVEKIWGLLMQ